MWSVSVDDDIKNNSFKSVYLFYGKELYLKTQYKNRLNNAINAGDMNTNWYSGKSVNVSEVIDQAETLPFLSDRRVIFLEDTGLAKVSCPQLADYISQIPEFTILVMVEDEVDKKGLVYKACNEYGSVVEFSLPNEDDLKIWLLSRIKKESKTITSGAYKLLMERAGDDMQRLSLELEKLIGYIGERTEITQNDVDILVVKQTEAKVYDMVKNVAFGNQQAALNTYYELLAAKEPAMRILSILGKQFYQMYTVKQLQAAGMQNVQIAVKMKLREFVIKSLSSQANRYTDDTLKGAIRECVELEEAVKTGKLNEDMSVELFLIKYSANERRR